jgi:hypothetical protein
MPDIVADGKTRVSWVPAVANLAAPTTTELNAGMQLQSTMTASGLSGLQPETAKVDTSSLASTFATSVNGRTSFGDIELEFKKQSGTDTVYTTLTRDTAGFLVVRTGFAESAAWASNQGGSLGGALRVYPMQCGEVSHRDPEENSLERYGVPMTVTSTPNLRASVA